MLKLAGEKLEGQLAEHIARLDAHTKSKYELLRTGEYFWPWNVSGSGTLVTVANILYAIPYLVSRTITFDRLALRVTTGGAGGTKLRVGIYSNLAGSVAPGTLALDAGEVAADGVAVVAATISKQLTKGLYWLVCISDGTPTLRRMNLDWSPMGVSVSTLNATNAMYSKADPSAPTWFNALAATFPTSLTTVADTAFILMMRVLTLD